MSIIEQKWRLNGLMHYIEYPVVAVWIVLYYLLQMNNYYNSGNIDMFSFEQAIYNIATGNNMFLRSNALIFFADHSLYIGTFLGTHFAPILYVIAFIYKFTNIPLPNLLNLVEAIAVGSAAIPIYWFSEEQLGGRLREMTPAIMISYLLSPLIILDVSQFHIEDLLIPFLTFALYYGFYRNWKMFAVFSFLAMISFEYSTILLASIVLFLFLLKVIKKYVAIALFSFFVFSYFLIEYIIEIMPRYFVSAVNIYSVVTLNSPSMIIHNLLFDRGLLFSNLSFQLINKILYVFLLEMPVAAVNIFTPQSLVMLFPWLSEMFFSGYIGYISLFNQYISFTAFAIYLPSVLSIKKIAFNKKVVGMVIIAVSIVSFFNVFYYPFIQSSNPMMISEENYLHNFSMNHSNAFIAVPTEYSSYMFTSNVYVFNNLPSVFAVSPYYSNINETNYNTQYNIIMDKIRFQYIIIPVNTSNSYSEAYLQFMQPYLANYTLIYSINGTNGIQIWQLKNQ